MLEAVHPALVALAVFGASGVAIVALVAGVGPASVHDYRSDGGNTGAIKNIGPIQAVSYDL